MKAKNSGNFKAVPLPEPQTTVARCYSLIDIGTIPNIYQGKLQGTVHKIFITWELPNLKGVFSDERGEEPFVVSEELTLSTKDNSNMAKLIAQWRGKPFTPQEEEEFDPTVMVGKTALIQIMHRTKKKFEGQNLKEITNENTNLKLSSIMKRPRDMAIPDQINPTMIWDWEAIESGEEVFDKEKWERIPNFIKDKMRDSEEFKKFAPAGLESENGNNQPAESAQSSQPAAADNKPVTDDEW